MNVKFFGHDLEVGGPYLTTDLRDSNDILNDGVALRERLQRDGYLLIREIRDPQLILAARRQILEAMQSRNLFEIRIGVDARCHQLRRAARKHHRRSS